MRKILFILLTLVLLLAACSKKDTKTSLIQLPDDYSLDDAKSDQCVVFEDSDITYGQSIWDDFVKTTKRGKSATVRLAYYYTLGDPSHYAKEYYDKIKDDYPLLYIKDLSYDGKKYTLEGIENGQKIKNVYKYMMKYEGQPSTTTAIFSYYTYYVLVDDNTITWDGIESKMLSSKSGDFINHYTVYSDYIMK